jgi:hypothetical protein
MAAPPRRLASSVKKAYLTLKALAAEYKDAERSMSSRDRILANACMAGAMSLDTVMGSKKEWENLDAEYADRVLDDDQEFIVCKDHKTHRTYGDIAKWLPAGLGECMRTYKSLPRPSGITTFLVPSKAGAARVDIPSLLKTFARLYLPKQKVAPTVNMIRKMFHTESEDDDDADRHVCAAWSAGFVFGVREPEPTHLGTENELVEAAAMPAAPTAHMEAEDDDAARMQIDSEGVEPEQKVLE